MRCLPLLLAALALSCGESIAAPPLCPEGRRPSAAGRCVPALPAQPCAAGSFAVPGQLACVPAGPTSCPEGFQREPSGWGCVPLLPQGPCEGARMERIGSAACEPVAACDRPFPPPEADLVVDPAGGAGRLRTIGAALSQARAGSTVAVFPGRYPESLLIPGGVHLVGKCAEEVLLLPDGRGYSGLAVVGASGVTIRGITVRGLPGGLVLLEGAEALVRESVFEDSQGGGLVVSGGSRLTAEDVVVRGTVDVPGGLRGVGLLVEEGAQAQARRLVVAESDGFGVVATGALAGAASRIELVDTLVRDTTGGAGGRGVLVIEGGEARLSRVVIDRSAAGGLTAIGAGVSVEASELVVRDTAPGGTLSWSGPARVGISGGLGAVLTLSDVLLSDNAIGALYGSGEGTFIHLTRGVLLRGGRGLTFDRGAQARLEDSAVVSSRLVGLLVHGDEQGLSSVAARRLVVSDMQPLEGVARAISVEGGRLELSESAILLAREVGMMVALAGGEARLTAVRVSKTQSVEEAPGFYGHGVVVRDGALLDLHQSIVEDNAGIGLAFAGAAGRVRESVIARNGTGVHVQEGSVVHEVEDAPAAPGPGEVLLDRACVFEANGTRLGTGTVPLPSTTGP